MKTDHRFTPVEANRTLPLVKRIVADILETAALVRSAYASNNGEFDLQCQKNLARLQELLAELEAIGCVFKDYNFTMGLVDFPGVIDDREVCWCWRSDEPDLRYYHDVEAGFAGRKPIPDIYLQPSTATTRSHK